MARVFLFCWCVLAGGVRNDKSDDNGTALEVEQIHSSIDQGKTRNSSTPWAVNEAFAVESVHSSTDQGQTSSSLTQLAVSEALEVAAVRSSVDQGKTLDSSTQLAVNEGMEVELINSSIDKGKTLRSATELAVDDVVAHTPNETAKGASGSRKGGKKARWRKPALLAAALVASTVVGGADAFHVGGAGVAVGGRAASMTPQIAPDSGHGKKNIWGALGLGGKQNNLALQNDLAFLTYNEKTEFQKLFGEVKLGEEVGVFQAHLDTVFHTGQELVFNNKQHSKTSTVFIYTSRMGDHNSAFTLSAATAKGMLHKATKGNVYLKVVGSAAEATKYLKEHKKEFGTVTDFVLGGHGGQDRLHLGHDTLTAKGNKLSNLLSALEGVVTVEGNKRTKVFLDSCLTATMSKELCSTYSEGGNAELNFAMTVAKMMPGVQVMGFDESISDVKWGSRPTAEVYNDDGTKLLKMIRPFTICYNSLLRKFTQSLLEKEMVQSQDVELPAMRSGAVLGPDTHEACMGAGVEEACVSIFVFSEISWSEKGTCMRFNSANDVRDYFFDVSVDGQVEWQ